MANNYQARDANGNILTVVSTNLGNDANGYPINLPKSTPSDATGNAFGDANPSSVAVQPRQVTYIDRSAGTSGNAANVTTTSGQILAANSSRKGFIIVNLDLNNIIWINYGATATVGAGSIPVLPYGYYEAPLHMMVTQQINAISSAGTVLFTAKECV